MEISTITSIQNQLVTHINNTIKASIDDEIVVDKTILTCCPPDEDIRLIMDTEFRKLLINDGLFYTGASNSDQLCIEKIKSYPIDYTDIRKAMKMSVRAQDISSSVIDMYLMLYYDETNNIKKFKLNEEKHKFNVPADTIYVLGGIEGEGTVNIEDIKSIFNLQDSVQEVKSHHIYNGVFADCLKSERLERFLDLLIQNDWHIHFNSLNVLYWSIVDILDSIDGFVSQRPANIYMFKALFYRVMKSNLSSFFDLVLKYRYPNIDSQDITAFMKDLIFMCKSYNYSSGDAESGLIEWLEMGSRQKELVFVQDEEELVMLTELSLLYRSEISTWINSRLIMDNEIDIIYDFKKNPVSVDG